MMSRKVTFVLICLLVVTMLAACGATPTPTPPPTPSSPQALLEIAMAAQQEESYHFEMEMEMSVTQTGMTMEVPMSFVGDFQPPDRVQGMMSITMFGFTIETETIAIGETTYAMDPDTGEWMAGAEEISPFAPEDFTTVAPEAIEDLTLVGEETRDGTRVYHLRGSVPAEVMGDTFAGIEGDMHVEYWIRVEDGRLRQSVVEGELSVAGEEGTIELAATMTYSDYGQEVSIEPPEMPTPVPLATFQPAEPTTTPPVPEAMGELEPGWTSYMTEDEVEYIGSGTLVGSLWVDIAVASDGTLWFVTLGGGVMHFDGETWTHYTQDDGLNSNVGLTSVAGRGPLGGTGDMQWFATAEGVCRFDGETWTAYPESAHLAGGPGPLALGPDGALWYGTASGATRFDGEEWITYTTADGLAANYVLDMVVGPEGAMWFGTLGGVSRFDGETWTSWTTANGLAQNRVASIALAPDGALWLGTEGGVSRFDGETWTTYTTFDGLVNDDVSAVAAAGSVLWFGTSGGVSRFDGETWTSFTTADGLVHDNVSAVAVAPDGAVWFATEGGLSRYMPTETSDLGYSFSLDREVVDVFWNEDGSLSLAYEFTFSNDPFASSIDFVDVVIPSQDYRLEQIYAEVDGHVVRHIAESEVAAGAIELGLDENAIMAGATGRVSVQIEGIQRVLSADPGDERYASAVFAPTWFAPEFTHGVTELTVVVHLPPGVQSDEARWHDAPPGWPAEPTASLDEQGRISFTWHNPEANGYTQYLFGVSFPKAYVPEGKAVEHLRRGMDYYDQGQLQLAVEELTQAIEFDSEFAEAYQFRGMVYVALGELEKGIADLDRALPDLDQAVELDPRLAEAYFNRGVAYFFMLDYDKAIADLDRATELNPSYVEAYAVRGNAYDNNGEFDKAISSYGEALALDLDEGQHALLLFDRGQAYARHGDKDLAIADLEKALELGLPSVVAEQAEAILGSLGE